MTHPLLIGGALVLVGVGLIVALDRILVRRHTPRFVQQLQAWRDDTSDPELKIKPVKLPPVKELKARALTRMELLERRRG